MKPTKSRKTKFIQAYKYETVEFLVKVRINYSDATGRKEAIRKAKQCVTSTSILGSNGCVPKSAKLYKKE